MLKRFLLNSLSSFVGTWLAIVLFSVAAVFLVLGLVGSSLGSGQEVPQVKSRSILKINLEGQIAEREMAMEPDFSTLMQGKLERPQTLDVITEAIKEASRNDDIVALYLHCGALAASPATLDAIRHEVENFKKSGKKVFAYGDGISQGCYYIVSAADRIYLNPGGEINLQGLSSTGFYFKNLLDKFGVEMQVVKVGTYKSAVEPYIMNEMSEPARAQMDTLLNNMWGYIKSRIAHSRKGVSVGTIDSLINKAYISIASRNEIMKSGLVDSLVYERDMKKVLAGIAGVDPEKLNVVEPSALIAQTPWSDAYDAKNQIAVLYACGEIADGNNNAINYETLVPVITELADNDKVKGLVLRVNSPGGSVFGSEQIGEALDYFQSKGKPLAVSMGDYAASGGYWISARANRIFADPLTITGSIGIFGLIPNVKGTLDMIGVTPQTVSTDPGADFPTLFKPLDETQRAAMQKYVERGYEDFVGRVAKGRRMSVAKVKRIGEGRVWDAISAKRIGLVDSIAYLQDAVEWVAAKAGVSSKYDISAYPLVEKNIWSMLSVGGMSMADFKAAVENRDNDILKKYFIRRILSRKPVQARMSEFKVMM